MREVAALALAALLAVAGGAKLFDPASTRRSVRELGLPSRLGGPVAIALPLVELALALGLVVAATSRAAAAAAAALLTAFAVVIGVNAARGRRVECGCFGALHSSTTDVFAGARTAALAAVAVAVAATPAVHVDWVDLVAAGGLVALVGQGALWLTLLRRYGRALHRIDELESAAPRSELRVGTAATVFALDDVHGSRVDVRKLLADGLQVVVAFVDARCEPCRALVPELGRSQRALAGSAAVVVVGRGEVEALRALTHGHGVSFVVPDDGAIAELYGADATPSALLIAADGTVAVPLVSGATAVTELLRSVPVSGDAVIRVRRRGARVAAPALAGMMAVTGSAQAGTTSPARPSTSGLTATMDTLHVRLGEVTERLHRALANLPPPERTPAQAAATTVARWAATGRSLVAGAQREVGRAPGRRARTEALAYLSSLSRGFAAFERAGRAKDLGLAAKHARAGAGHFRRAGQRFPTLDRALGCPFGCTPVKQANP